MGKFEDDEADARDGYRVVTADDVPVVVFEVEWWVDEKRSWFDEHHREREQVYQFVHRKQFENEARANELYDTICRDPDGRYDPTIFKLVTLKDRVKRESLMHAGGRTDESDERAREHLAGLRKLKRLMHSGAELDEALDVAMPRSVADVVRACGPTQLGLDADDVF